MYFENLIFLNYFFYLDNHFFYPKFLSNISQFFPQIHLVRLSSSNHYLYKNWHFLVDLSEDGKGTAINGIFKTDNSNKVEAPALVIQRSALCNFIEIFQTKNFIFNIIFE